MGTSSWASIVAKNPKKQSEIIKRLFFIFSIIYATKVSETNVLLGNLCYQLKEGNVNLL
jgi:hypothetical protein